MSEPKSELRIGHSAKQNPSTPSRGDERNRIESVAEPDENSVANPTEFPTMKELQENYRKRFPIESEKGFKIKNCPSKNLRKSAP